MATLHLVDIGNSRYRSGQNQRKQPRRFYQIEWLSNVIEMEQHWQSAGVPHSGAFMFHVCIRRVITNTKILILKFIINEGCVVFSYCSQLCGRLLKLSSCHMQMHVWVKGYLCPSFMVSSYKTLVWICKSYITANCKSWSWQDYLCVL